MSGPLKKSPVAQSKLLTTMVKVKLVSPFSLKAHTRMITVMASGTIVIHMIKIVLKQILQLRTPMIPTTVSSMLVALIGITRTPAKKVVRLS